MKKPNERIKRDILRYKKAGMDLAPLLKDIELRDLDLSYSYISELRRSDNLTHVNLSHSKGVFILQGATLRHARFCGTIFEQGSSLRGADLRYANLMGANFGNIDYAHADLRGANICGIVFPFGSKKGYKAIISKNIVDLMYRFFDVRDDGTEINIPEFLQKK